MAREIGRLRVSGRLLAHNTFYNLSANVFALAVGVVVLAATVLREPARPYVITAIDYHLLDFDEARLAAHVQIHG